VPLCEAYLGVTSDAVKGSARTNEKLRAAVHEAWAEKMRNKGPLRVGRLPSALAKQFKRIWAGVIAFTSHYLAVKATETTGNPSQEDIVSGAVARYCSLDVYDEIRADHKEEKVNHKTRKRKAKVVGGSAHSLFQVTSWLLRGDTGASCVARKSPRGATNRVIPWIQGNTQANGGPHTMHAPRFSF